MTFSCSDGYDGKYCYSFAEVARWLIDIYGLSYDNFLSIIDSLECLPEYYYNEDLGLVIWRHE